MSRVSKRGMRLLKRKRIKQDQVPGSMAVYSSLVFSKDDEVAAHNMY